jgi:hypothetical protein
MTQKYTVAVAVAVANMKLVVSSITLVHYYSILISYYSFFLPWEIRNAAKAKR